MADYIKSGLMHKMLMSPKAKPMSDYEEALLDRIDPMEAELERLRTPSHGCGIAHLTGYGHIRAWELRHEIARLSIQFKESRRETDPGWFEYWGT